MSCVFCQFYWFPNILLHLLSFCFSNDVFKCIKNKMEIDFVSQAICVSQLNIFVEVKDDEVDKTNARIHLGTYGTIKFSENALTASTPRTSFSCSGSLITWKSSYKSPISSKYFDWTLYRALHMWHGSSLSDLISNWFTMILCVSMPQTVNSCTRRSVSYSDRNSAMHTQTNVVCSGLRNCSLTCRMVASISSSFTLNDSALKSWLPNKVPTCDSSGAICCFNRNNRPRPFSTTCGNDRRRRVCPVGAVSNTTIEKFIDLINLLGTRRIKKKKRNLNWKLACVWE